MYVDVEKSLPELRARGLIPEDARCVFLAGSIIRGWGNARSDIDVYAFSPGAWTGSFVEAVDVGLMPPFVPVNAVRLGERRWDIEYWQTAQVDQLLAKVSWAEYDSGNLALHGVGLHEIDLLDRFTYARPLLGAEWLETKVGELAESALKTHLVEQRLNQADIFVEDAVGQLQAHDFACAALSARLAFGCAVDALTASHGEFGHSVKWRPKRLQAVTQPVLTFDEYWRVETMQSYSPQRPGTWVQETLELCRRIALAVAT